MPSRFDQSNLPAIVIEVLDSSLEKKNNYYQDIRRVKISVIIATKQFY
jgi:hypothetical protein